MLFYQKTCISQNVGFLDLFENVIKQVIKNHVTIHQKAITNSIQNRSAEKYRNMMQQWKTKDRKWTPKGSQKSTESIQQTIPEKWWKLVKTIVPGARALRRTNQVKKIVRATQPTHYLNGRSNSLHNYSGKILNRCGNLIHKLFQDNAKLMLAMMRK